jgi:[ribosomal protein S5]-alanine N-acetyltransferase
MKPHPQITQIRTEKKLKGKLPIKLTTARLSLREWEEDDLAAIRKYVTDPEVYRFMPWGPNTEEESVGFLKGRIAAAQENPRPSYEFAITVQESGELIGGCGIRISSPENRSGDLGYVLRRDCWGKGYATECAHALLNFGFSELHLHRIWATCDSRNAASARVLEKVGMRQEAYLRDNAWQRGQWRDTLIFAILENEYSTT